MIPCFKEHRTKKLICLKNQRFKWNDSNFTLIIELCEYTLDFRNRSIIKSTKNLQIIYPENGN